MWKNKEKKASKGVDHILLEVSQSSIITPGSPKKKKLQTDTGISEKSKKKRKRDDLSDQPGENKVSQIGDREQGEKQKKKKKKKEKHENETLDKVLSQSCEPEQEYVDVDTPSRKKKKKRRESNVVTHEEYVYNEEAIVIVDSASEKNDEMIQKKKKKYKTKHKGRGVSAEHNGVKSVVGPADNKSNLVERLKEFFPNLNPEDKETVNKMIAYDLARFEEFKKYGIVPNLGKFSAEENRILRKNVEDFMALTGIDSPSKLFFTSRYKDEQNSINKLKKQHRFFERIAEGIPKTCQTVYARGRRIFDPHAYKGVFTEEEIHTLQKLHTLHGNNWKKISEITGRSAYSLQKRFAQIIKDAKVGTWSSEEVQRLLRAVRDHIISQLPSGTVQVQREILYKKLPWQSISEQVQTRSWCKCREKWMDILTLKMSSGTFRMEKKAVETKIKLIKAMYEMQVDDAAYVNWEDLTALIGDVPPAYVQKKWHRLKVCYVPQWQIKSFAEIVDFLFEKVLPRLVKELKDYQDPDETQKAQKDSFFLSDIFQGVNVEDVENGDKCIGDY